MGGGKMCGGPHDMLMKILSGEGMAGMMGEQDKVAKAARLSPGYNDMKIKKSRLMMTLVGGKDQNDAY
jgi:hypothetical protein